MQRDTLRRQMLRTGAYSVVTSTIHIALKRENLLANCFAPLLHTHYESEYGRRRQETVAY